MQKSESRNLKKNSYVKICRRSCSCMDWCNFIHNDEQGFVWRYRPTPLRLHLSLRYKILAATPGHSLHVQVLDLEGGPGQGGQLIPPQKKKFGADEYIWVLSSYFALTNQHDFKGRSENQRIMLHTKTWLLTLFGWYPIIPLLKNSSHAPVQ